MISIGIMLTILILTYIAEFCILCTYKAIPCIAKKGEKDVITLVYVKRKYAKYLIEDKRNLVDVEVEI